MTTPSALTIHIDGAARGNPGPAAFAYVIEGNGMAAVEEKGCLGTATNNVAEYTALLRALQRAAELGAERLLVYSDSDLLVKQMNGLYQVKSPELRGLHGEARRLARRFAVVSLQHVRREQNARADRLCNEALDRQAGKTAGARGGPARRAAARAPVREAALREEVIACLRSVAAAWSRGDAGDLSPEWVWDQIRSLLEEHGLLPPAKS